MVIYDKLAAGYDAAMAPLERWFLRRWRAETLALLPDGGRILEVGTGTGANFRLYPTAELAVASEISGEMLRSASGKAGPIVIVQADAQHLPFGPSVFDAAFATLVFCSIPDLRAAFDELRRVVRPGGRIVLLEHVRPNGPLGYFFDLLNLFTVALIEDHFNRRTVDIAAECGLKVVEVRTKAAGAVCLAVCEVTK